MARISCILSDLPRHAPEAVRCCPETHTRQLSGAALTAWEGARSRFLSLTRPGRGGTGRDRRRNHSSFESFGVCVLSGCLLAGWAAPVSAAGTNAPAAGARKIVRFVVDEWKPMEPLLTFLEGQGTWDVRRNEQTALPAPAEMARDYAVVMSVHGPLKPAAGNAMLDYALAGGRLVMLHHGIASARMHNPRWTKLTGVFMAPRDNLEWPWAVCYPTTLTLVSLRPGHYITTHKITWPEEVEYTSSDTPSRPVMLPALSLTNTEAYFNQQFTDGRAKTVLLGMDCTDPRTGKRTMQDRAGWYKRAGKGWMFYFMAGHAASDYRNPVYRQLIENCLTWQPGLCAGQDTTGAKTKGTTD